MFRHLLLAPVYLIYKLWIGFVFWTTLLLLYPAFRYFVANESRYPAAFRLKRVWSRMLQVLFFCPVRIVRKAPLPLPPFIIASNHSSHLDTVFMYHVFDQYFVFIGKSELLKWPLFRLFFRTMDIPVDRANSKKAFVSLQKAYDAIDKNHCVAIYPEGGIPLSSPRMKPFKNGAFRMAIDKQIPIVPVTFQNMYKVMNNPEKLFSPSLPQVIRIVVHEPVLPPHDANDSDLIALRNEIFKTIDSALPEGVRRT